MKVLVAYSSLTGNTETVAKAIVSALQDKFETTLSKISQVRSIEEYDVILVGFWGNRAIANSEAKKFIASIRKKKVGLFGTLGAKPSSSHGIDTMNHTVACLSKDNELIATFLCNGKVDMAAISRMEKVPNFIISRELKDRMIRIGEESRAPSEKDLNDAQEIFLKALQ